MPPCLPVCLDVTRLVTRAGRGPLTGIDRVELAWLRHLAKRGSSRFLLRSTRGYIMLGPEGARRLKAFAAGETPGPADIWSRTFGRGGEMRHRVEAGLRALAVDRVLPNGLNRLLARALPRDAVYLNTGHANLSQRVLTACGAQGLTSAILIHDTIPIDHPDFVRHGQAETFRAQLSRVFDHAALIITPSASVAQDVTRHGGKRPICIAPLGVEVERPPDASHFAPTEPYFVAIGTLEPRKNHALLIDVWEKLAADPPPGGVPHLHFIGRRGWRNAAFLDRLDRHPMRGSSIFEHNDLSDAETWRYLAQAKALLYPSLAEGFGFPPLEARALGVPHLVSDLPVLRETSGDQAIYLSPTEPYPWEKAIRQIMTEKPPGQGIAGHVPDWGSHFARVENALARIAEGEGWADEGD